MGIDINKIILESISNVTKNDENLETEKETEELNESTKLVQNKVKPKKKSSSSCVSENTLSTFETLIPQALSAGLGAVTFRNRLRTLSEADLEDTVELLGKVGKGAWKFGSKVAEAGVDSAKNIGSAAVKAYADSSDSVKPVLAGGGALLGVKALSSLSRKAGEARNRLASYVSGNQDSQGSY